MEIVRVDTLVLFHDLNRKALNLLGLNMRLAMDFLEIPFVRLRKCPSNSSLLSVFIMEGYVFLYVY